MALHSKDRFLSWQPALFDGEFDWDFILPAFMKTKIQPMDFDAVIERRGKFLIFETKIPGKEIGKGQRITLTAQWKQGATIFVLSGKRPEEINGMAIYYPGNFSAGREVGDRPILPCDAFDVVYRTRCWFCWADGNSPPSREQWDRELWVWDYERGEIGDK